MREREREFHQSIQPALAYEDAMKDCSSFKYSSCKSGQRLLRVALLHPVTLGIISLSVTLDIAFTKACLIATRFQEQRAYR